MAKNNFKSHKFDILVAFFNTIYLNSTYVIGNRLNVGSMLVNRVSGLSGWPSIEQMLG